VLASLVVLRVSVGNDLFPWWSGDPTIIGAPVIGLTAFASLLCDALTLVAAGATVLVLSKERKSVGILTCGLFASGAAAAAFHGLWARDDRLEHFIAGAHWTASIGAGIGVFAAGRERVLRGLLAGVMLSVVAVLAAKGVVQLYVDHPATLRMFAETRETVFASQGWTPGSPMALSYERRLQQPEATGWLGMSNVLGTLAAASFVGLFGCLMLWRRGESRVGAAALATGVISAAVCLALAKSKGGTVACAAGLAVLTSAWLLNRMALNGRAISKRGRLMVGPAAILVPLVVVAVRGLVGERIAELSLLFRSFYLEAAARIMAAHPFMGVGPAGFKDAYLLFKDPISPEEVALPHSVFIDWISTLGVGGLGWSLIVLWFASRIGRVLVGMNAEPLASEARGPLTKPIFLVLAGATLVASFIERPIASVDAMAIRMFGLFAGTWIAGEVARIVQDSGRARGVGIALGAAALTAGVHTQIELTGTHMGSAPWLMAMIGLAAACWNPVNLPPLPRVSAVVFPVLAAAAATVIGVGMVGVWRWEADLARAAREVVELPDLHARMRAFAASSPQPGDTLERLARDLERLSGRSVGTSPSAVEAAALQYTDSAVGRAETAMADARRRAPGHFATVEAYTKLAVQSALRSGRREDVERLINEADEFAEAHPSAPTFAWLSMIQRSVGEMWGEKERLAAGAEALKRAAEMSPFDVQLHLMLADVRAALGEREAAGAAARKALDLSEMMRLDRVKMLTVEQRVRMERMTE